MKQSIQNMSPSIPVVVGGGVGRTSFSSQRSLSIRNHSDQSGKVKRDIKTIAIVDKVVTLVGSATSFMVSATFFLVLAWKRDALMVSFFLGAISNGILSKVLKRIINQTRPAELQFTQRNYVPGDNGMPSSHAMSLGFISTFTAIHLPWTRLWLVIYDVISLAYRLKVKLHTLEQILVGMIIGSVNGFAWYHLCTGINPFEIHVMQVVTRYLLDDQGRLPVAMLAITLVSYQRIT